jgi:hypothetical protein
MKFQDPNILYISLLILIIIIIIVINNQSEKYIEGFSPCDVDISNAFELPLLITMATPFLCVIS